MFCAAMSGMFLENQAGGIMVLVSRILASMGRTMLTDMEKNALETFRPQVQMPADFVSFWSNTLQESRQIPALAQMQRVDSPIETLEFYDVTFPGFAGESIKGWLAGAPGFTKRENQPLIVEYLGYGVGRGVPGERMFWPSAGYVHLIMDSRGQGGDCGTGGATPDPHPAPPHAFGFFTLGVENRETYYFRRLITDAYRAIDAALTLNFIDPRRVFVAGASQGGTLAACVGARHDGVRAVLSDLALGNVMYGVGHNDHMPYREVQRYLRAYPDRYDQVETTLSYFDAVNFARHATRPAYFSVSLSDEYVPPACTYSIFNEWSGDKSMEVYPFNEHDDPNLHHLLKQHAWLEQFH